jgi:hypothetical protein
MANPTTNYGWPMPTATDLVTDLPADFAAFGQPVDTSLKALNPGTTLGDLAYSSATANTNTRLGIGTTGQVLAVSGGVPAWTTPTGASLAIAEIASGTVTSGTSLSLTSLTSYDTLKLRITGITSGGSPNYTARINNSSSAVYDRNTWGPSYDSTSTVYDPTTQNSFSTSATSIQLNVSLQDTGASTNNWFAIDFYNCKATGFTTYEYQGGFVPSNGANYRQSVIGNGIFKTAAAVSSIEFITSQAFTAGNYVLWGA